MRVLIASLLMLFLAPVSAQDAERGRLLYQTHCGGCHYERVHERPRERSRVHSLGQLRDEVAARAALTGRPFTLEDLADLAEYLNQTHYRFGLGQTGARELIFGAELMTPEERERYRKDLAAADERGGGQVRERHRERLRARARERGVRLDESTGLVKP